MRVTIEAKDMKVGDIVSVNADDVKSAWVVIDIVNSTNSKDVLVFSGRWFDAERPFEFAGIFKFAAMRHAIFIVSRLSQEEAAREIVEAWTSLT